MKIFLIISFLLFIVLRTSGQTSDTSFVSFWTSFQKDIASKDFKELSSKTKYPLKAKGQLDYDSIDEYSAKNFQKVFSQFLSAKVHTNGSTTIDVL